MDYPSSHAGLTPLKPSHGRDRPAAPSPCGVLAGQPVDHSVPVLCPLLGGRGQRDDWHVHPVPALQGGGGGR